MISSFADPAFWLDYCPTPPSPRGRSYHINIISYHIISISYHIISYQYHIISYYIKLREPGLLTLSSSAPSRTALLCSYSLLFSSILFYSVI